jgi:hypothetical protein
MADAEPKTKQAPEEEAKPSGDPVMMHIIAQPWQTSIVVGDVVVTAEDSEVPADQVQAVYEHAQNVGVLVEEVIP